MSVRSTIRSLAFVAALGAASSVQATPTVQFWIDGAMVFECADGASCDDFDEIAGVVTISESFNGGTTLTATTGATQPLLPGSWMDLNSFSLTSLAGAHTFELRFSEDDFTALGDVVAKFGGTLSGGSVSLEYMTYWDSDNVLFAMDSLMTSCGVISTSPFACTAYGAGPTSGPYSLTQRIIWKTDGFAFFSGDAELQVVPEPGSLALLSLGLAGLALTRRRKQ